jgi:predicted esterase
MNKPVAILLCFICRLFLFTMENSCSCQPFAAGKVMDTIRVRSDRKESYALYLPPDYTALSPWPVVYFFEPGGRGSLPLQMYKDLAREYGFILICSNNIRNGAFDIMEPIAERLFEDTQARFSVDTAHVYFAGFSGGSKLAFRLALKNPFVSAVIGCGACYPVAGLQKSNIRFIYSGIVGTCDMNYYSMHQNKNILDNLGVPYYLICFEGSHSWPPVGIFNEALWWTMIQDNLKSKENFPELYSLMSLAIDSAIEENNYYNASLRAMEMKKLFANTAYEIPADSILHRINHDPLYTVQIKKLNRTAKEEASFQHEIVNAFITISNARYNQTDTVYTPSYWESQHKRCCKLISSKDPEKQKLGKRMDGLIVAFFYEQGEGYMADHDYKRSVMVYNILVLFRPESWYVYLQLARCYKGLNQPQKAKRYLEIARKKGLKEYEEN